MASRSPRKSVSSTSEDTELRKAHELIKKHLAKTQSKVSKETSS